MRGVGLVVSALDPGACARGWNPGRGHCVVFMGEILDSLQLDPPDAVFKLSMIVLTQTSLTCFKQSRISRLIPHIRVSSR